MGDTDKNIKVLQILGTGNRYQITKLKKEPKIIKKRKEFEKWENIPSEYFDCDIHPTLINEIHNEQEPPHHYDFIKCQITIKLAGYKQQDVDKQRYNEEGFIKFTEVIAKMHSCKLKCYYCNQSTLLLYENVRENKQWTLDRIDNDIGHEEYNVIIACLECNLRRRRTNTSAFLFTKQLKIVRVDINS
jgi:hypothetical protein